jgi:hypothetical protein
MARQSLGETLGRFLACDLAYGEGVISGHSITHQANIGLGRSRLLVSPGVSQQIPVEFFPATVKTFNRVLATKLLNTAGCIH